MHLYCTAGVTSSSCDSYVSTVDGVNAHLRQQRRRQLQGALCRGAGLSFLAPARQQRLRGRLGSRALHGIVAPAWAELPFAGMLATEGCRLRLRLHA